MAVPNSKIPVISGFLTQPQKFTIQGDYENAKKLNTAQQETLFASECKLINLRYEYQGYTGTEIWAIVSELSEKELFEKYPDVISRYTPFVLLSIEQGKVIDESYRNTHKYEMRCKRTYDLYDYKDGIAECFHKELITPFVDSFEQEELDKAARKLEKERIKMIKKVRKALAMLQPIQRERLLKNIIRGLSSREIAKEEGVNYSSVDKSIAAAKKNFKKFYENL